jgi:ATP-dependent DNA helicase RecQ
MGELGIEVAGKIGPDLSAGPGRALGRLTDLGWGPRLRALLDPSEPDRDVPEDVIEAVVEVLASWRWDQRPAAIVSVPSASRPQLVGSLARRIAEIGRLPDLGPLSYRDGGESAFPGGSSRQHNSAHRLHAVWQRFAAPAPLWTGLASLSGPVLLIDDQVDTGWTVTVAAKVLREAGAPAVLPLVLAVASG